MGPQRQKDYLNAACPWADLAQQQLAPECPLCSQPGATPWAHGRVRPRDKKILTRLCKNVRNF